MHGSGIAYLYNQARVCDDESFDDHAEQLVTKWCSSAIP